MFYTLCSILATLRYACRPHKVHYTIHTVADYTKMFHAILYSEYYVLSWPPGQNNISNKIAFQLMMS